MYPGDEFDLDFGKAEPLHLPAGVRPPRRQGRRRDRSAGGRTPGGYVARYPDGRTHVHVLDRAQVEYHRSFSRQPDGEMWTKSYDAAALKSVVLDMKRWLPLTPQLAVAQAADGTVIDVRDLDPDQPELPAPDPDDAADAEWVAEAKGEIVNEIECGHEWESNDAVLDHDDGWHHCIRTNGHDRDRMHICECGTVEEIRR